MFWDAAAATPPAASSAGASEPAYAGGGAPQVGDLPPNEASVLWVYDRLGPKLAPRLAPALADLDERGPDALLPQTLEEDRTQFRRMVRAPTRA